LNWSSSSSFSSSSNSSSSSYILNWSSSSSSSSSSYVLSKRNKVIIYSQAYGIPDGNVGVVFAGERQLFDQRSGDVGGICVDQSGNIYVADPVYHIILKIKTDGTVIVWAGKTGVAGNNGNDRVLGKNARFNTPSGISIDKSGVLYIADKGNNQIRRITQDQYVNLVAGNPNGLSGYKGGIGTNALFNAPNDVAVDKSGNIYVADTNNHAVRLIRSGISQVITVAGNGIAGDGYGVGVQSILRYPNSVAAKPNGEIYIMDSGNYKIKLLNNGFNVVRFSGSGVAGSYLGDALTSQYNNLFYSDVDPSGNLYVIDFKGIDDSRILRINGNGIPGIIRDFVGSGGDYSIGVTVNNTGVLYVTESEPG
jgi:sugar lactone lactonase YvrE